MQRRKANEYLRMLEDGRTFARWSERAFMEAIKLAPDQVARQEALGLRVMAAKLRKAAYGVKIAGLSRFNPRRR